MPKKLFRTHTKDLTDDELLLLDVMFDSAVVPPMLRQCNIYAQFLVRPHSLDDAALHETLQRFLKNDIVRTLEASFRGHRYIALTGHGAALWSSERCPIWERYCDDRIFATVRDETLASVRAVSPVIRDDYLRIAHPNPIRVKRTTIRDNGMIQWKSFDCLHVGLVSYIEPKMESADDIETWVQERWDRITSVERERTWWRNVGELQKFTNQMERL